MTNRSSPSSLPVDLESIRARYREERDKRLRRDGIAQYRPIEDTFDHALDDPFSSPPAPRSAVRESLDVLVLGGGFCGMCAAARLTQAGVERFRIVENAADFGGTWYWNRYPGVQCDIESYVYLPLLEEVETMPTRKYVHGAEIFAHAQAMGRRFDLYRRTLFQTNVVRLEWDEASACWQVGTDRGDRLRARFVVMATGPLNKPKLPNIPGIDSFSGKIFHTSRWDYAYTGGDASGGLTQLRDKRVGVIGTGATAIQVVPHLGAWSRRLYVFQRTPSAVDARHDRPTDPAWFRSQRPGWQRERIWNFSTALSGGLLEEDLVADGWTDIMRNLASVAARRDGSALTPERIAEEAELVDHRKMEEIRQRVSTIVKDPKTAEALKPWYRQFCKRPCFHDDYLATFNRENVTLVDSEGRGVEAFTRQGVVVLGREYAVDCVVLATGFEVGTDYSRRAGCEIVGCDGTTLTQRWKAGIRTHHGLFTRGFPNLILMGGIQAGHSPNFTELFDEQSEHAAWVVAQALRRGHARLEPTVAAEDAWLGLVQQATPAQIEFATSCTPGYYNNEGQPFAGPGWFGGSFGGGPQAYFAVLRRWREQGDFEGMTVA